MVRILIFGDSFAWGAWDINGGWVEKLKSYFMRRLLKDPNDYNCIYNLGVSGDSSDDILKRFSFEAKHTVSGEQKNIIIFAFGINDPRFTKSPDKPLVPGKRFVRNLESLYKKARAHSDNIIFVGPTPVYEPETSPWFEGIYYSNELIGKYDLLIETFCKKKKLTYLNTFNIFKNLNLKDYIEDGLHPNSKGHELVFKTVLEELIKSKILLKNQ